VGRRALQRCAEQRQHLRAGVLHRTLRRSRVCTTQCPVWAGTLPPDRNFFRGTGDQSWRRASYSQARAKAQWRWALPGAVARAGCEPRRGGRLVHRQTGEDPPLTAVGTRLVVPLQPPQRLIDGERFLVGRLVRHGEAVEFQALRAAPPLLPPLVAGAV